VYLKPKQVSDPFRALFWYRSKEWFLETGLTCFLKSVFQAKIVFVLFVLKTSCQMRMHFVLKHDFLLNKLSNMLSLPSSSFSHPHHPLPPYTHHHTTTHQGTVMKMFLFEIFVDIFVMEY
jgi:hypothetical protein